MEGKYFNTEMMRNNLKLGYELFGNGNEKIIFLPGIMSSHYTWMNQIKYILKQYPQYQIAYFYYRGLGNSDFEPANNGIRDHSLDLLDFINYLNWDKTHLVGTSFGSQVAFDFALHSSHRVNSMFLAAMKPPHKNFILEVSLLQDSINNNDYDTFQELLFSKYFLNYTTSDGLEIKQKIFKTLNNRFIEGKNVSIEILKDQFKSTFNYLITNEDCLKIRQRNFPLSIIYGSNDALYPIKDTLKLIDLIKPESFSIFNGCGHVLQNERYNEFNKEMDKALKLKRQLGYSEITIYNNIYKNNNNTIKKLNIKNNQSTFSILKHIEDVNPIHNDKYSLALKFFRKFNKIK